MGVALGDDEGVIGIEVRTLLHAVAALHSLEGVVEVDVGIVGGLVLSADGAVDADRSVDLVGVAVDVGMYGAVDHGADVDKEQQAAEHVSALSVILVHGSCFNILEVRLFFSFFGFFLSTHI